jgi:hypothetical protein
MSTDWRDGAQPLMVGMKRTLEQNAASYFRYSGVMSNAHYDMAEIYRLRHRRFGILVVVVTSVAGAAALGSLAKLADPSFESLIKVGIALLSLLATVLAALQTFFGFSDLQNQHKRAGDGYSTARREIESLVMKYPNATGETGEKGTNEFDSVKKILDDLDKTSPTIPDTVYDRAAAKTPSDSAS